MYVKMKNVVKKYFNGFFLNNDLRMCESNYVILTHILDKNLIFIPLNYSCELNVNFIRGKGNLWGVNVLVSFR